MITRIIFIFSLVFILYNTSYSQVVTRRGNAEWIKSQNKILSNEKPEKYKTSKQHIRNEINNLKKYSANEENTLGITVDIELDINKNGRWDYSNDSINIFHGIIMG